MYQELYQDTLSKAREVALRILQNTVYQMVEQIPQVTLLKLFKEYPHQTYKGLLETSVY